MVQESLGIPESPRYDLKPRKVRLKGSLNSYQYPVKRPLEASLFYLGNQIKEERRRKKGERREEGKRNKGKWRGQEGRNPRRDSRSPKKLSGGQEQADILEGLTYPQVAPTMVHNPSHPTSSLARKKIQGNGWWQRLTHSLVGQALLLNLKNGSGASRRLFKKERRLHDQAPWTTSQNTSFEV